MATLFDRLSGAQPPPTERTTQTAAKEPRKEIIPAQKLLEWLQRWQKPTICTREICIYGPPSLRYRQIALSSAEILAAHGWLIPIKKRKGHWQVVRRPVFFPIVATEPLEISA